jgi:hypothetical protein
MTHKTHFPICYFCTHFDSAYWEENLGNFRCVAFPEIPDEIIEDEFDHRQPHPDDTGIRFEKVDSFTEYMQRSAFSNFTSLEIIEEAFAETINCIEHIKQHWLEAGMDVSSHNVDAAE